jgi:hypothetical protein
MERPTHRVLKIDEVLWRVLDFARAETGGVRTVSVMAFTSRSFAELALDVLWAEQDSLRPLIKCIPACIWESVRTSKSNCHLVRICIFSDLVCVLIIGLKQNLLPSQWRRFDGYARRIKTLRLSEPQPKYDRRILTILQTYTRGSPLLPRLRALEFLAPKCHQFLDLLLRSRLVTLAIQFNYDAQNFAITQALARQPPLYIQEFTVLAQSSEAITDVEMSDRVSDVICKLSRLREITCEIPLNDDALSHVFNSMSPRIIRVEADVLDLHNFLVQFSLPITQPRHLTLRTEDLTLISLFLEYLCPSHLDSLAIKCTHEDAPSRAVLSKLLRAVHDFCSHDMLNTFRINHWEMWENHVLYDPSSLQDLFVFRNMKEINIPYHFAMDDNTVKQLAHAWPKLHTFSVRTCNGIELPLVTLEGLLELITSCPLLSHMLEIDIHVSKYALQTSMDSKITNAKITLIMFNDSTCDVDVDPVELGTFLLRVFPSLESIDCCGDDIWRMVRDFVSMENVHRVK